MDVATVRLLSIHIAALLPPTSTELAVPHNIQVTAIMGIGLIYQGTANRHIAEVLLQEIGQLDWFALNISQIHGFNKSLL